MAATQDCIALFLYKSMNTIGLFPLGIVLFPGSSLPLHIFEPRYKELIGLCIRQHSAFGVNFVDSAKLCEVGCTAVISDVLERYPDGRLDVVITGERRYRLERFAEDKASYFTGEVDYLADEPEAVRFELIAECVEYYNKIIRSVFEKAAVGIAEIAAKNYPSYFLAEKSGLSLPQKQFLLESRSESHRLQTLLFHLRQSLPHVREAERIRAIIESDGYIPGAFNEQ